MSTSTATAEQPKTQVVGRIARVTGPVVDIEFPHDAIPGIYNALKDDDHDRRGVDGDHPRGGSAPR